MNEKFNKNTKVEQLTKVVLSHGEEKGLIVKDPLKRGLNVSRAAAMLKIAGQLACFDLNFIRTGINHEIYYCIFHYFN